MEQTIQGSNLFLSVELPGDFLELLAGCGLQDGAEERDGPTVGTQNPGWIRCSLFDCVFMVVLVDTERGGESV